MNGRKGQSAMEYLMTYGWAILVIIIVISVLFYMGILNPRNVTPSSCTFPPGFSCASFKLKGHNDGIGGYLDLTLGQAVGHPIKITGIECTQEESAPDEVASGVYDYAEEGDLAPATGYQPLAFAFGPAPKSASLEGSTEFAGPLPTNTIPPQPPGPYEDFTAVPVPMGERRRIVGEGSDNPYFLCTDNTGEANTGFNTGAQTQFGEFYKGKIWIAYNETDTNLNRTIMGEIATKFER